MRRGMTKKEVISTGAFYTPKIWVDELHKMLSSHLGEDWKDKYIVWDASCGPATLTRDYKFKNLFLSTLEQVDIDIIKESGYNPEATVFQFDFLNDPLSKLPDELQKHLQNGAKFVFLNNPPFGRRVGLSVLNQKCGNLNSETILSQRISLIMSGMKIGGGDDMYTQFLFRIIYDFFGLNFVDGYNVNPDSYLALFGKGGIFSRKYLFSFLQFLQQNTINIESCLFSSFEFNNACSNLTPWPVYMGILKKCN